jgi:periplasmic protein TonB
MSSMRTMAVTGVACAMLATLALSAQQTAPMRVYNESTPGIVLPTVVSRENPPYTRAAMDANLAGNAAVDVTVDADGRVRDVLLVQSLDAVHGLDDAAVATAGRWVFKPGTLNGQPVPVRVRLSMSFKTR